MKNPYVRKLVACVLILAAGVAFIIFGCISFKEVKTFPEVSAVVTRVDKEIVNNGEDSSEEITAYVRYTVDGKEYNEILQNHSGNISENDQITVRYNPEKPEYVTGATKGSGTLQLVVGIVLCVAGTVSAAVAFIKGR